jgi:transcriptional regulator with XRE-family HTH domain
MSIGHHLEAYRLQKGLNYKELSAELRLDPGNVCRLVHGQQRWLAPFTICRLARHLGITVEELIGYEPEEAPDEFDKAS